tara:strand:+ start:194 stop:643 length:450 start_codon:yes stop_codon:yes gene_type:complete
MYDFKVVDIETIDVEDLVIDNEAENNIDVSNMDYEVFYSYPYQVDDRYEYQYRITINDKELILDEVKCDEEEEHLDSCVIYLSNIQTILINDAIKSIKSNLDIRTNNPFKKIKIGLNDLPLDINSESEKLEEAKSYCLKELLSEVITTI